MSVRHLDNDTFWSRYPCGRDFSAKTEDTPEFFAEIEEERYRRQPYLFGFAQFTRFAGKKVLEIGTGQGTDFAQWARSGAELYGVDLTQEAVNATARNLAWRGLGCAELRTANAERLPHPDDTFDLVYSWGVIHHTADVGKAVSEILRVLKPGGSAKIMVYHLHSMVSRYVWLRHCLLKGRPWHGLAWGMERFVQNRGTRAYSLRQWRRLLRDRGAVDIRARSVLTFADRLEQHRKPWLSAVASAAAYLCGWDRAGLYLLSEFKKP